MKILMIFIKEFKKIICKLTKHKFNIINNFEIDFIMTDSIFSSDIFT